MDCLSQLYELPRIKKKASNDSCLDLPFVGCRHGLEGE